MMPSAQDHYTHDIVLLADMARDSDIGLRIRRELELYAAQGYRCALRHLPAGAGKPILPDIRRCLREGLAEALAPEAEVVARLAVVFAPSLVKDPVPGLGRMRADRVVLVLDRAPNPDQMGRWFSFNFGQMSWAPTNRWVRAKLEEIEFPVPIAPEDWRSVAGPCRPRPEVAPLRLRPVVGRVSATGAAQWPKTKEELAALYPAGAGFDVWVLGAPPADLIKDYAPAKKWTVLSATDITVERFIEALNVFMYFPSALTPELPEAAISSAMASGKVVVLPPHLKPHFGPGALYCEPAAAPAAIAALFEDAAALAALRATARDHCRYLFSGEAHLARIAALIGPTPGTPAAPARPVSGRKRVLFVPSNGVGLGHAARLLAIARRMEDRVEPVFASLGQAGAIIESFGFTAEYIPSYSDIGAPVDDWDAWFRPELEEVIARHRPEVVVYDGNNPTPGLVQAVLAQGDCRMVWVRRALCPPKPSPYMGNARFFDCIIEPGELAADRDTGPTVALRHEVRAVAPIRLLDAAELLPRDEARRRLGLAPDRPAVLIQLGAGGNRDILDLIDRVVTGLRPFEGLQVVIAEWSNGAIRLPHWPGTIRLRGFPISQFFNAFDFSVAAAGYNTFHEVMGFGLPTIFLANRHPSMDDQGARAGFAQDASAGFDLTEEEFHAFPALCEALLTPQANAFLRANCAAMDGANGAAEAAAIILSLAGET
jgi:hypothetical protein